MALRVNKKTISVSGALLSKINLAIDDAARKKLEKSQKLQVGNVIKRAHAGAQQVVDDALTKGFSPVAIAASRADTGSVSKVLNYTSPVTGAGRRYKPAPWKVLTRPYGIRKPTSKVFWRKHFSWGDYPRGRAPVLSLFRQARLGAERIKTRRTKYVKSGKNLVLTWDYRLKTPQNILAHMITYPLVQASQTSGKTHFRYPGAITKADRNKIEMIAWVEADRPFIVGVSAQIGADMYQQIRKLLRRS